MNMAPAPTLPLRQGAEHESRALRIRSRQQSGHSMPNFPTGKPTRHTTQHTMHRSRLADRLPADGLVWLGRLQGPGDLVVGEDDAGLKCLRADELE